MTNKVRNELHKLERDRHIKILYAAEAGSRVWGFESPDSDYDVRFIYCRPMASYISISSRRDVIEAKELPEMGDLDLSGWDIIKTLELANRSNPALLEWLRSPIVYHSIPMFTMELRQIANSFNMKAILNHYSSMAKTQYMRHLNGTGEHVKYKKYFYALYPLLAGMHIQRTYLQSGIPEIPPLRFETLLANAQWNDKVRYITPFVTELLKTKRATLEKDDMPRVDAVDSFIRTHVDIVREFAKIAPDDREPDLMSLEDLCTRTIKQYG